MEMSGIPESSPMVMLIQYSGGEVDHFDGCFGFRCVKMRSFEGIRETVLCF